MIPIGEMTTRTCAGIERREFLQVGAAGFLGLSLPSWLRAESAGAADPSNDLSCISLFMWGGPPQQDTFDLKPNAPDIYRGPYNPISTRVPGIQFCELLPILSNNSDLFTIVRSATHEEVEHPRAAHYMMTGNQVIRGREWPNMGATVNKYGTSDDAPIGSVVVGPRMIDQPITPRGQDGGFLGNRYAPFRIAESTKSLDEIASLSPPPVVADSRVARRKRLFQTVTEFQRQVESDETLILDSAYKRAFNLVTSPEAKMAFDLSREPERVRERYGDTPFGQGALMARRLVEAGVRFVQVNWREHPISNYGFDNHGDNFRKLKAQQLPEVDQVVSALLLDLKARGRLEKTIVFMAGEFGRTPKINKNAGRDHWPNVYSYLIAGGEIAGGQVIGSSDEFAAYPVDDPVSPGNTIATIFSKLGLDLNKLHAAGVVDETHTIPQLVT